MSRLVGYLTTICFIAILLVGPAVLAQTAPGDAKAGERLARDVCANCHFVEQGQQGIFLDGAPAFQDMANDPAITALALRVLLRTPHETMPNLVLSEIETDDIISYILNLK